MIQKASSPQQTEQAATLACCLWPRHSPQELREEWEGRLEQGKAAIFLAEEQGQPVGFAYCDLRHDYVAGTSTSPVGYLEGIFVQPEFRGMGIARALLTACEVWAVEMGCREFASDCELDNTQSLAFHLGVGFSEIERLICFSKKLSGERE